jgi:hypothetical protein
MSLPLFFAVYCIEAGVFFAVVPWTRIWVYHPLLHHSVELAIWMDNPFVRGFVSGIGVVHIIVGSGELMKIIRARRAGGDGSPGAGSSG